MAEMGSSYNSYLREVIDFDIDRRKRLVDLQPDDITRILSVKDCVLDHIDSHVAIFFEYLERIGETPILFQRHDLLEDAKRMKRDHLVSVAQGDYGRKYVEQRIDLILIYSRVGLTSRVFIGAYRQVLDAVISNIFAKFGRAVNKAQACVASMQKLAFFDIGIGTDVLTAEGQRTIGAQSMALLALSTPVLQLRDRLLILPIIGILDSQRAKQLTDNLLHAIRANRAKVVVIDITGVASVDSRVANHLVQTVAAARLMGAKTIVTGLSAEVAQSLVTLGVDLGDINTMGDLQGGLEEAEKTLGYKMVVSGDA